MVKEIILADAHDSKFQEGSFEIRQGEIEQPSPDNDYSQYRLRAKIGEKEGAIHFETFSSDGSLEKELDLPDFTPDRSYASARELANAFAHSSSTKFVDVTTRGRILQTCTKEAAYFRTLRD